MQEEVLGIDFVEKYLKLLNNQEMTDHSCSHLIRRLLILLPILLIIAYQ